MESKVVATGVAVPTTVETVVATSDTVFYSSGAGEGLIVRGAVNFTEGTGGTAVNIRVRKGTTVAGALVGTVDIVTLAAGATATIPFEKLDTAPVNYSPTAGATGAQLGPANQYVVTAQQTAATANGTANYATIGMTPAATGW